METIDLIYLCLSYWTWILEYGLTLESSSITSDSDRDLSIWAPKRAPIDNAELSFELCE